MSEPQPFVIGLLQQMIATQQETNTLLRRIVPDNQPLGLSLYDLLLGALFRPVIDQDEQVTYRSLTEEVFRLLQGEGEGAQTAAQMLDTIATRLFGIANSSALTASATADTYSLLFNQLSETAGAGNLINQIASISGNTGLLQPLASSGNTTAENTLAILNQLRTTTTENGAANVRSVAELLYALGLCSCEDFLNGGTEPPPLPEFPPCFASVQGVDDEVYQFGPVVPLGFVSYAGDVLEAYVHTVPQQEVFSGIAKAMTPLPTASGKAWLNVRGSSEAWVSFGDVVTWVEGSGNGPRFMLLVDWRGGDTPSASDLDDMLAFVSSGRVVEIGFEASCIPIESVPDNQVPSDEVGWYGLITLWPDGFGPGTQEEANRAYIRLFGPPGP